MRVESIKAKLEQVLKDYELRIFSVKTKREFGEKILEILLKGKGITTDLLAEIHLKLFESLDEGDMDDDHYLELSSVGAEYPLNNLEEIKEHLNGYIYLETNKFRGVALLLDLVDETLLIEFNDKGNFRKIKIEYNDILKIRSSVKI